MPQRIQPVRAFHGAPIGEMRRLWQRLLNVVLPPQCLGCGTLIDASGGLCATCWSKMTLIDRPWCDICGLPFQYDLGTGALCGACLRERPEYEHARSAIVYNDGSRGLILAFKHGDRTDAAGTFARWMMRVGMEVIGDADLITAVPLHWTRLLTRRYNQAALMAQAVGSLSGVRVIPDLLVRRKRTPPLGKLGPQARLSTVRSVFSVPSRHAAPLADARVLLIDDVYTTGATTRSCARALLRAGAKAVDVLTLARVVRDAS